MIRFGGSRAWDFQDCFADLKEPNCEGYLKRSAAISDSYTCTECSIGSLKNIFRGSLIHTSINSVHFIVSPCISPMLLSNTDPPPYLDISVHEPVPVQASSHTLQNADGLLQSKCHRPQHTGPASKSGRDNILINLMGQLSCLDIPVQMGLNT